MDIGLTERDVIEGAITAARAHGADLELAKIAPQAGNIRADAAIVLKVGDRAKQFLVEVKKGLRPATLGAVLLQLRELEEEGGRAMLVTDYVTPQIATTLREHGVTFVDVAGNAFINEPPVLIWVKGERPPDNTPAEQAQGRAFRATGLKVVFALLCQPEWVTRPYREIARIADVAHGTVGWVMADLNQAGFIIKLKGQQRRLRNRRRLLDMWVEAYARGLRAKLVLGRYEAGTRDWWRTVRVQEYAMQLGGEPAAAELDGYLQPGIATFYGEKVPGKFIADHHLRTNPNGDVEVRKRFWNFEYAWKWPTLVPPVLIYADLLAVGDARCIEVAQRIYEAHLAGLIEQD